MVSGAPVAMEKLFEDLQLKNTLCRLVKVDVASHSPQMDPLLGDLVSALKGLRPLPANIPFYSTVTGTLRNDLSFDAAYWSDNLRKPVRFSKMVEKILEDGITVFIEISPHPILLQAIDETMQYSNKAGFVIPSLLRDEGEQTAMLTALGKCYTLGYAIDWTKFYPSSRRSVSLPKYSWDHQRYWIKAISPGSAAFLQGRQQTSGEKEHPLLGIRLPSFAHMPGSFVWQTKIDNTFCMYLKDQKITDPVQGLVYAAISTLFGEKTHLITEIHSLAPINLTTPTGSALQLVLTTQGKSSVSFQMFEQPTDRTEMWNKLVEGQVELGETDSNWLYKLLWQAKSIPSKSVTTEQGNGTWLIFSDKRGVGEHLAKLLESHGHHSFTVFCGDDFHANGNGFVINPEVPGRIQTSISRYLGET